MSDQLLHRHKHGSHTALLAGRGRKYVELILMVGTKKKRLSTERLTEDEFALHWEPVPDYPDAKAIAHYVRWAKERGCTKRVRELFVALINQL